MKSMSHLIIIATVVSVCTVLLSDNGVLFEKNGGAGIDKLLSFDKSSESVAAAQQSFKNIVRPMQRRFDSLFERVGGYEMVQFFAEEPVLFGALFIFFGVSACSVVFVVHLIRSDARLI